MNAFDLKSRSAKRAKSRSMEPSRLELAPGVRVKTLAAATALAFITLPSAQQALAQSIGELDVRSRVGERFFAVAPIDGERGPLDPRCVRVRPNPSAPPGAQSLEGVRVRIGNAGASEAVIIETAGAVMNPMVALRLEVGCDSPLTRDFLVLGEGVQVPGLAETFAPAPAVAEAPAPSVAPAQRAPVRPPVARATPRVAAAPTAAVPPVPAIPQPAVPRTDRIPAPAAIPPAAAAPPAPPQPAAKAPAAPRAADALPAVPPVPTATDAEATRRLAELRARSDDQAASLLALEDRLALLQKQAELLKAQLEYALASGATQQAAAAPAAAAPAPAPVATPAAEPKPAQPVA
jgi:uncharacterized coiled-coil protein SlyX